MDAITVHSTRQLRLDLQAGVSLAPRVSESWLPKNDDQLAQVSKSIVLLARLTSKLELEDLHNRPHPYIRGRPDCYKQCGAPEVNDSIISITVGLTRFRAWCSESCTTQAVRCMCSIFSFPGWFQVVVQQQSSLYTILSSTRSLSTLSLGFTRRGCGLMLRGDSSSNYGRFPGRCHTRRSRPPTSASLSRRSP